MVTENPDQRGRPRRVLLTLPELAVGGGPVIALNAARHIDRSRYEVHVLALYPERTDMVPAFRELGIEPVVLDHRPGRSIVESPRVARLLKERRIDLVHISGADERRLAAYASFLARVPVVMHIHSEWVHVGVPLAPGTPWHQRPHKLVLRGLRDRVEHHVTREYLADSPSAAAIFRPHVRHPIHVMTQSMPFDAMAEAAAGHDDAAWRARFGIGPGPVAMNISRHVPGKGQDRVIRAFAAVRSSVPDAQLVLVGDGELFEAHRQLAADLGLADAVHFLGMRTDVPQLLAGADVFAFASTTESFGLVVAEAMAARVAVVAYALPSITAYVEHGKGALLPAQHDEIGFAQAFTSLMADARLRRRVADGGFDAVSERFPADAAARSFEGAYDRVLFGGPVTARSSSRRAAVRACEPESAGAGATASPQR